MESILVTGAGGGVGQSILKSLHGTGYRAVAADGEPLAAGLYAAARGYLIPYASRPEFVDRLLDICRREGCRLLFPGLDAELPVLARAADRFRAAGVTAVVSSPQVVDVCDDKLATADFLARHGFPSPVTRPLAEGLAAVAEAVPFPMVLKPRKGGARSKGVFVVRDPTELADRAAAVDPANYVAQEQILGDEYTCGTVNVGGRCQGVIVMRRVLRDGDTYKAFVEQDPALTEYVAAVADALRPFGACNFQLRVRDAKPYAFEFNARCSGTTYCRTLAGFNEPRMVADFLLHGRPPAFDIRTISVLRYWKELVVGNDQIAALREHGVVDDAGARL